MAATNPLTGRGDFPRLFQKSLPGQQAADLQDQKSKHGPTFENEWRAAWNVGKNPRCRKQQNLQPHENVVNGHTKKGAIEAVQREKPSPLTRKTNELSSRVFPADPEEDGAAKARISDPTAGHRD